MLHETVKIVPIIELTPLKYLLCFIPCEMIAPVYLFTQRRGFARNGFAVRRATVTSGVSHSTVERPFAT